MKIRRNAQRSRMDVVVALVLLGYVVAVHTIDTLAAEGVEYVVDWSRFRRTVAGGFDLFKFVVWFVVPLVGLLALGRVRWEYFTFGRWRKVDWAILGALVFAGLLAVLSIRVFPSLERWYPGYGDAPGSIRWAFARHDLIWTFSWIVGWEFIHRYALLTQFERVWPRFGWMVVPLVEGGYHLQKDPLEMVAMVAFSVVLTQWALRRRNVLLPFLAHLSVEVELVLFRLVVP